MNGFLYHTPRSLDEAFDLLDENGEDARIIAGGTALVLFMKQRLVQPRHLVSLQKIPLRNGVAVTEDGVRIGATCTHRMMETSSMVQEVFPILVETYSRVATTRIRNMATVGGGLVHADPNSDPPPSLIVLGAKIVLVSSSGNREVPVEKFFRDYYEPDVQPGEILTEVIAPRVPPNSGTAFIKFLPRTDDDYATVSVAVLLTVEEDGITCRDVRLGLGSVATTPIRARGAEGAMRGRTVTRELVRQAADLVDVEIDPQDDFRGSARYKRQMAQVLTRRAIERALSSLSRSCTSTSLRCSK